MFTVNCESICNTISDLFFSLLPQAKLFPTAVVHFGSEQCRGEWNFLSSSADRVALIVDPEELHPFVQSSSDKG